MLNTKVAEMGEVEEREKDIEKALRHTHTEMVSAIMYAWIMKLFSIGFQALLHQNCQSLLNENISLKTTASLSQSDNRIPPNTNGSSPELKQLLSDMG